MRQDIYTYIKFIDLKSMAVNMKRAAPQTFIALQGCLLVLASMDEFPTLSNRSIHPFCNGKVNYKAYISRLNLEIRIEPNGYGALSCLAFSIVKHKLAMYSG